MILDSPIISGSSTVTGNLTVLGTLTANVSGSVTSASYATNAETLDGLDSTSFTTTSSFNTASGSFSTRVTNLESFSSSLDATFATDAQLTSVSQSFSSSLSTVSGSLASRVANNEATGSSLTTASSSFSTRTSALETASGSFSTRVTGLETASGSFSTRVTSTEGSVSSLNNKTSSYATTGSNIFSGTQTITGSLFITENLTVLGSSSISYVSQSTLNIGTNLITVNAQNPSIRFGGLAVIDSGSAPQVSGSWLFDSIQDRWIMIHQQSAGAALTSSIGIMGPETYNNLGSETTLTLNRLVKGFSGASGEHIGDSNISDTGTVVSINSATQVTGSLGVTGASTFASSVTADSLNINTSTVFVKASIADTLTATSIGSNYNPGILNIQNKSATNGNLSLIGFQDASQFINLAAMGSINETHAGSPNSVTGALAFYTKTSGTGFISERMRITSGGNVGIGTTSPTTALHVLANSGLDEGNAAAIIRQGGGNNNNGLLVDVTNSVNAYIADFRQGNSSLVRITGAGNVGIGTTSPNHKLDINGALSVDAFGDAAANYITMRTGFAPSSTGGLGFMATDHSGAGQDGLACYGHDGISYYTAQTERMRITSGGLISMGNTSISNGTSFGGGGQINRLKVESGNYTCLEINGSTSGGSLQFTYGTNLPNQVGGLIGYNYANGTVNEFVLSNALSGAMIFATNNTERMRITSGGKVGINNTSPNNVFDIYDQTYNSNTVGILSARSRGGGQFITGRTVTAETSNQTLTIATFSAPNPTNERIFVKIQVVNTSAVSDYGNVHVGYALWSKVGTKSVTTMTLDNGNSNIGNSNVGTLSWSGDNLQYSTNRLGNYELNAITIWGSARDSGTIS